MIRKINRQQIIVLVLFLVIFVLVIAVYMMEQKRYREELGWMEEEEVEMEGGEEGEGIDGWQGGQIGDSLYEPWREVADDKNYTEEEIAAMSPEEQRHILGEDLDGLGLVDYNDF